MYPPCSLTMIPTPWKKPLNLGFALRWSLMNFTLTVSMGVTAKMASITPAPSPHSNLLLILKLPSGWTIWFLRASKEPNLGKVIDQNIVCLSQIFMAFFFSFSFLGSLPLPHSQFLKMVNKPWTTRIRRCFLTKLIALSEKITIKTYRIMLSKSMVFKNKKKSFVPSIKGGEFCIANQSAENSAPPITERNSLTPIRDPLQFV